MLFLPNLLTSTTTTTTTVSRPFSCDHQAEPVPEENFWTLWCKRRLTEANTPTIFTGATPSRLTSAHLHHPPFFTGRMPFLPPNQQCQSTEGNLLTSTENTKSKPGEQPELYNKPRLMRITKFTTMQNNHASETKNTVTQTKDKQVKPIFGCFLRPMAWKWSGPILTGKDE